MKFFVLIIWNILSESVENFILNKMSYEKFQLDKNYRIFMVGIGRKILIVFSCFLMI